LCFRKRSGIDLLLLLEATICQDNLLPSAEKEEDAGDVRAADPQYKYTFRRINHLRERRPVAFALLNLLDTSNDEIMQRQICAA
jgi:hypothetical protein